MCRAEECAEERTWRALFLLFCRFQMVLDVEIYEHLLLKGLFLMNGGEMRTTRRDSDDAIVSSALTWPLLAFARAMPLTFSV